LALAWADLLAGFAFYLIFEGLFPFVSPRSWRRGLAAMAELHDGQLRTVGLVIVGIGMLLLFFARS